ncbi:MAG: DUF4178 domain-containing protein [Gallionella sp.]
MKISNCPSCGARVVFRSTASIMAVCEYCQSTLLRRAEDIENIGKMADLLDDASLIQLGTEGRYRGMNFTVIGRIQMQYQQGVWNEWYVLFDNQRGGWLSDANGDYTMTFVMDINTPLPDWNALTAGMTIKLNGDPFVVMDIENSQCVAGAGELPFKVGAGFAAPSVDLRFERQFASIDYSEATPLLFFGASVDFAELNFSRLRDPAQVGVGKIKLNAFQCPNCAAPIEIHAAGIARVTCPSCFALLDAEHPQLKLLQKFKEQIKIEPVIPLGSEGKLNDVNYRVLGFLRREGKSDGILYHWDEYLLHHPQQGFFWLVEYQGHWSFARPCKAPPAIGLGGIALYQHQDYQHFSKGNVTVDYVLGEFYWRVAVGEKATVSDYIAPPYSLSQEKTNNEITWTHSEYLDAAIVKTAFGVTRNLPMQHGVAANQVWAGEAGYHQVWRWFWGITVLMIVVQLISVWQSDDRTTLSGTFQFPAGNAPAITSPVFALTGHTGNLHLINHTNLDNDWSAISMELVNRDTGEVYEINREISFYHGSDEDGYWSEGSTTDDALVANVPSGNYVLSLAAESQHPLTTQIEIRRNVSNWHNVFLIELLLLLFPVIYWWRRTSFEALRWADSDHPKASPSEMITSGTDD